MEKIFITIGEVKPTGIKADFQSQAEYQSIIAYQIVGGKKNVLDSELLDGKDFEEDLETLKTFPERWKKIAIKKRIQFKVDPTVAQSISDIEDDRELR